MKRTSLCVLSGFICASFLLSGCGTTTETTSETIKIGSLQPISGSLADYGPKIVDGMELAIAQINAAGGVLGKNLELVEADSGSSPATSATNAQGLINANVVAIVGAASSACSAEAYPIAESAGIPMISPASTSPSLTGTSNYFFRTVPSDALQGKVAAQYLVSQNYTSISFLYIDNSYGTDFMEIVSANFVSAGRIVKAAVSYAAPTNNQGLSYVTELNQCCTSNPDVLMIMSYTTEAPQMIKDWYANYSSIPVFWGESGKTTSIPGTADWTKSNGIKGIAPAVLNTTGVTAFKSEYQAMHGYAPGPYADAAYDAIVLLALAIAKGGNTSGTTLLTNLPLVSKGAASTATVVNAGATGVAAGLTAASAGTDINYEGAAGPVDFDSNNDVEAPYDIWQYNGTTQEIDIIEAARTPQ
jgi:ABC-type branched-subunit amino acid transport system substrate-binding protein